MDIERGFKKLCEIVRGRLCPCCQQKFDAAVEHPPRLTPMPTAAPDSARAFVAAQRFWEILNAADICDHCREGVVLCIGDLVADTLNAPLTRVTPAPGDEIMNCIETASMPLGAQIATVREEYAIAGKSLAETVPPDLVRSCDETLDACAAHLAETTGAFDAIVEERCQEVRR